MSSGALMLGLLGAVLMPAIYGIVLRVRIVLARIDGKPGPSEWRAVYVAVISIGGFICGVLLYQPAMESLRCHDLGQPLGSCMAATLFPPN